MSKPKPAPHALPALVPETLGLEEAAAYLHLGRDATYRLWQHGDLPGTSLNQKHLVFRRAALDAFLADMETQQTAKRRKAAAALEAANDADRALPAKPRRRARPMSDLTRYSDAASNDPQ